MTEVVINHAKKKSEEVTYKIGDWFMYGKDGKDPYILTHYESCRVCLVGLDGSRYCNPVIVSDYTKITLEEFSEICYNQPLRFTKLSKVTITCE